jgi:hypothetical protein
MNALRRFVLLAVVAAWPVAAWPVPAHAYFETTSAGARGAALGNGIIAASFDATAFHWNPAGLARLEHPEGLADYGKPFEIPELNGNTLAASVPWRGVGWSAGWQRLAVSSVYAEDLFTLAAGRTMWTSVAHRVSAGATFKYGRVGFQPFTDGETGTVVDLGSQAKGSLDVGLLWNTPWSMDFAWVGRDLLRPRYQLLPGTPGDRLETRNELGASLRWNPESTILIGWAQPEEGSATFNLGLEIVFYDVFAVRSGVINVSNIYRSAASTPPRRPTTISACPTRPRCACR